MAEAGEIATGSAGRSRAPPYQSSPDAPPHLGTGGLARRGLLSGARPRPRAPVAGAPDRKPAAHDCDARREELRSGGVAGAARDELLHGSGADGGGRPAGGRRHVRPRL
eukprot:scaffold2976_cov66-Phaeocystis_antarctica.AAC.1